jgi:Type II CAAX prenyl endopeptidase Rce1-like
LSELVIVIIFAILGLAAQAAKKHKWIEWFIRVLIFITFLVEAWMLVYPLEGEPTNPWYYWVNGSGCAISGLLLFMVMRKGLSKILGFINSIVTGGMFKSLRERATNKDVPLISDPVFIAESVPHMNGLFLFVCTIGYLLSQMNPALDMQVPTMPLPLPVELPSLFSYNWLGLILLSVCGAGLLVSRKPGEVMARLGLTKISGVQLGIGGLLVVMSFLYDLLWSLYTHNASGDLATKLTNYNAGTFGVVGGMAPSVVLALMTAICAGMGEETLIRGALQPVFGIVPAAILHGVLHGQFAHAPIFILQVAGWSILMGIVKRYTNTTTTIIGHAGFNLVTTFLFAFNP